MDRLEDANKVTSLMRRRENPRHIPAARLMCNPALERRGFFEPKQRAVNTGMAGFSPVLPGPAAPRVASGADRYVQPRATRVPGGSASRRANASRIPIGGRGTRPMVPPRRQKLPAQVSRAPLVSLRCEVPAPPAAPRNFGMLRRGAIRVYLGEGALAPGAIEPRRVLDLAQRSELRNVKCSALEGKALRVSIGIGFHIGAANWRGFLSHPPAPAALVWPHTLRLFPRESHDSNASYRNLEVGISKVRARLPAVSTERRPAQFEFPGGLALRDRRAATGAQPGKRTTAISWRPSEPRSRGMAVLPPSAGLARRNGAHLFTLAVTPSSTLPVRQVAFTTFIPRDPVGCPRVAFEGTVAAAIAGSPSAEFADAETATRQPESPAKPAALVRIEEHFGSGWENWMGGTQGWLVDVAGVRTGPLALFVPSMELIDYQLDFLARIDTRSLTWVVRAAGLDEYLRCTLTAVGGGELEFSRCAVVAGAAQTPVTAAQRLPGKPRSAMTVSTRVSGDTVTVSVDGKRIDTWDDDRFPMGGIGFTGAPDDRARLYWVKLSSTELSDKEYRK